jgi:hypothetical protein
MTENEKQSENQGEAATVEKKVVWDVFYYS